MFIYLTIDFTSIQLVTSRLPGFETHSEYKAVWQLQTSTQNVPFIQMNRPNKQGLRIDFHDIIITIGQKKLHLLLKSDTAVGTYVKISLWRRENKRRDT